MDEEVKTEHQRALTALPEDVLNIIFEEALPVVLKTHHSMCVYSNIKITMYPLIITCNSCNLFKNIINTN